MPRFSVYALAGACLLLATSGPAQTSLDAQPVAAASRCSTRAQQRGSGSAAPTVFAATSFWDAPLRRATSVDPRSGAMMARLRDEVREELAARRGPWINTTSYSTPVYRVGNHTARRRVTLDHSRDAPLRRAFRHVPIPEHAAPASGTDGNLVVYQRSTDRMWEFWRMVRQPDGWHARWGGAMRHVSCNRGVFDKHAWPGAKPWWGASATSLPLLGGLIRRNDLATGKIDHALAIGLPELKAGSWRRPARRTDGTSTRDDAIPAGATLRVDPRLKLSSLRMKPLVRAMARAAQRYGIIVRDTSADVVFYAEDPKSLPGRGNPYTGNSRGGPPRRRGYFSGEWPDELLARFPWSHVRVVRPRRR